MNQNPRLAVASVLSLIVILVFSAGCSTASHRDIEPKPEPRPVAKVACDPPKERKPSSDPDAVFVEAFRCSMQPSPSLNVGIRIYSTSDGKLTNLIYGPDRMDTPPVENDSVLYNGVKVILAGSAEGKTVYSFQHRRISLQITVPRSSTKTDVFEAVYSDEGGASGVKGLCSRVSSVTY